MQSQEWTNSSVRHPRASRSFYSPTFFPHIANTQLFLLRASAQDVQLMILCGQMPHLTFFNANN